MIESRKHQEEFRVWFGVCDRQGDLKSPSPELASWSEDSLTRCHSAWCFRQVHLDLRQNQSLDGRKGRRRGELVVAFREPKHRRHFWGRIGEPSPRLGCHHDTMVGRTFSEDISGT